MISRCSTQRRGALPSNFKPATVILSLVPPIWTVALCSLGVYLGRPPRSSNWPQTQRKRQTIWNASSRLTPHSPGTLTASWDGWRLGFNPSGSPVRGLQTSLCLLPEFRFHRGTIRPASHFQVWLSQEKD